MAALTKLRSALIAAAALLVAACDRGVMNPAGDIARQQRDIIGISTGLMLLIIVPVMILIVIFAWRYRAGNAEATYDPEFDHSTSLELVIWSAPLLIIICLGALTWSSTHLLDPFRPLDKGKASTSGVDPGAAPVVAPLRVQVVSLDWKWLFIYPEQGIATVNELVLPVGRQVRFDLTSTNMMNTFYAPTMAGMIYTMPGMQSTLHAVLNRPVEDEGFSANYSGHGFSDMRFRIRGVPAGAFDRWAAAAKAGPALNTPAYLKLAEPSEKVPPMAFSSVEQGLFQRVVERCVKPGETCMSELMRHGQHGGSVVPPVRQSIPAQKPEGALFKQGEEKGEGKNVTAPAHPEHAPGVHQPGAEENRDMSVRPTLTLPGRAPAQAA